MVPYVTLYCLYVFLISPSFDASCFLVVVAFPGYLHRIVRKCALSEVSDQPMQSDEDLHWPHLWTAKDAKFLLTNMQTTKPLIRLR